MKHRIIRIIFVLLLITGVVHSVGGIKTFLNPQTIRAFGDLTVDFHVPVGTPIYSVANEKPGDSSTKPIDVTNSGAVARMVSIKGVRTGGTGVNPVLDHTLTIEIKNGPTTLYGPVRVDQFFAQSSGDGILLGTLPSGGHETLSMNVVFPTPSGNEYQGKSVQFDLTFGTVTSNHLVINEVYYQVDSANGVEKDEWVELYNPTGQDVSLKNWNIIDATGVAQKITANKSVPAGGFALLSKDAATWKFWSVPKNTQLVELGNLIGDGLTNTGDKVVLKDASGVIVDQMSWGTNISGFTPAGANPVVPLGKSSARTAPGFDTDVMSDWIAQTPPTPGQ